MTRNIGAVSLNILNVNKFIESNENQMEINSFEDQSCVSEITLEKLFFFNGAYFIFLFVFALKKSCWNAVQLARVCLLDCGTFLIGPLNELIFIKFY